MYFDPYMQKAMLLEDEDPNAVLEATGAPVSNAPAPLGVGMGMPQNAPTGLPMASEFQADPRLQGLAGIRGAFSNLGAVAGIPQGSNMFQNAIDQQMKQHELANQRMNALRMAQGQMPAGVREYEYYKGLSPEGQKAYERMKRGDQRTSLGKNAELYGEYFDDETALKIADGQYVLSEQDGANRLIDNTTGEVIYEAIDADAAQAIRAGQKGAETTAQKNAEQTAEAMKRLREISLGDVSFDQATQQISGWIDKLKDGQLETGLVSGFLTEIGLAGTELSGEALADSVEQALYNLQITNLAPVTEKEIQFIKGLFMDLKSPTDVNVGKLKAALRRINKAIEVADFDFKQQRNYVSEFGDNQQKAFIDKFFPAKVEGTKPDGTGALEQVGL